MKFIRQRRLSEANIQAEIYRQLINIGIECWLEYYFDVFYEGETKTLIADIIIVKNDNIVCTCEVKNYRKSFPNKYGSQYRRYESLGIPFVYCMNVGQITKCVSEIVKIYEAV